MAQARIKGQDVQVQLTANGVPYTTLLARSLEVTLQQEIKSEGYLNETTNRKDSVFNGVAGKIELHFSSSDVFKLFQTITDSARRKLPGAKVNVTATLNFPNGDTPKAVFPDVKFGEIPIGFGSRGDYGTVTLSFEGEDWKLLDV
jgi:hypothetical protein